MRQLSSTLKKKYPFQSKFFSCSGYNIHYVDEGRGNPVLLVHGNPSWSFMYRDLIQTLSTDLRVLAIDHIGCGLSEKPSKEEYPYLLERRIDDLTQFIESLQLKQKLSLVLHDWGGPIGLGYAVNHPDKINKIILMNTIGFRWPKEKSLPKVLSFARNSPLAPFLIQGLNAFTIGATFLGCKNNRMPRSVRKGYSFPHNSWKNRVSTLKFVQDIPLTSEDESYQSLEKIEKGLLRLKDKKVSICWGEKDFVFDLEILKHWNKYFPHAETHRYPQAGHYVLEDEPSAVITKIKNFLLGKIDDSI